MDAEPAVLYVEKQQYNLNKLWLIYLLIGFPLLGIIVSGTFEQMYSDGSFSNMPDTDVAFFLINGGILVLLLVIPLFINALVLTVQVYPDTLEIKLGPWIQRTVKLNEVREAEILKIDREEYLKEYGQRKPGWQLKSHNTYNVKWEQAVQLLLNDGTKILIGSQHPAELKQVLYRQANFMVKS